MNAALAFAALAAGLAASPHCAAMCGAPCAALTSGCRSDAATFHVGRLIGYAAGGALAAGSVSLLAQWSQAAPALRPVWTLLHLGFMAVGLFWLCRGRQPDLLMRGGAVAVKVVSRRRFRAGLAGLAWVAWPCAALQAALLLAALASSAGGGALVMGAYAVGSMPALALGPWLWSRMPARLVRADGRAAAIGIRIAGGCLVLASGWALTEGLWQRVAAWCLG